MGLMDSLLGKKKSRAKYVIDKEDDQREFLKSDEEMKSQSQKKTATKTSEDKKSTQQKTAKSQKSGAKIAAVKDSATKSVPSVKADKKSLSATKAIKESTSLLKSDNKTTPTAKAKKSSPSATKTTQKDTPPSETFVNEDEIDLEKTVAVKEGKETRNGKFDIRRAKDGRFFFCLYASNHAPIAYSQIYSSSAAATNGIDSIVSNSPKAPIEDTTLKNASALPFPKWEIYIDRAGEYRFRLYATNGLCICHASHGYTTTSGCKGGIESIKRFAKEAKVDKSYLN